MQKNVNVSDNYVQLLLELSINDDDVGLSTPSPGNYYPVTMNGPRIARHNQHETADSQSQ